MADHRILSQRAQAVLRCTLPPTGATLQEFTPQGVQQVDLDATELRAFLHALPPALLREVLGEQTPPALPSRPCVDCGHPHLRALCCDQCPCTGHPDWDLEEQEARAEEAAWRQVARDVRDDVPPAPVLDLRRSSLADDVAQGRYGPTLGRVTCIGRKENPFLGLDDPPHPQGGG